MDPLVTSALIGAGSSLLGGMFGSKGAKKQKKECQIHHIKEV